MSEKVILTKEQADGLEAFKKLRSSLEEWMHDRKDPNAARSIIHELTFDQIARALLIGYEIEPEQPKFKAGDKVIWSSRDGNITELCELDRERTGEGEKCWWCTDGDWATEKQMRLATPEEIYWLETLGREKVGDFRENDTFVGHDRSFFILNEIDIEDAQIWYKDGALKGLYPAESFKRYPQEESK